MVLGIGVSGITTWVTRRNGKSEPQNQKEAIAIYEQIGYNNLLLVGM